MMAKDDNATVNIPNDILTPIIAAKVAEVLGGQDRLLERLVSSVMSLKTSDRDGNYDYLTFIEKICRDTVREAAKDAVKDWVASNHDKLRDAVERSFKSKARGIASRLVDKLVEDVDSKHYFNVSLTLNGKDL